MSCLGLGTQFAQLCDGADQITLKRACDTNAPTTSTRVGSVADRVGNVPSFFGGLARSDRITRHDRPDRLPAEDLAQPPPVAQRPDEADRLGEERSGYLRVEAVTAAAGGA